MKFKHHILLLSFLLILLSLTSCSDEPASIWDNMSSLDIDETYVAVIMDGYEPDDSSVSCLVMSCYPGLSKEKSFITAGGIICFKRNDFNHTELNDGDEIRFQILAYKNDSRPHPYCYPLYFLLCEVKPVTENK